MCQLDNKGHGTEYRINTEPLQRVQAYTRDTRTYTPSTGRSSMYANRMYD